jgi:hypothetical protein
MIKIIIKKIKNTRTANKNGKHQIAKMAPDSFLGVKI